MTNIDTIFKSELTENEKLAKSYFGKLLIELKKNNDLKIYSLMGGVSDTKLIDNVLKLVFSDKSAYDLLNNENDANRINLILKSINENVKAELVLSSSKTFDEHQFTEYLKNEFNKILTIK